LGAASTRFHRPPSGLGLSDTAQAVIACMREVVNSYDHYSAEVCNHLLQNREENEAYLRAVPDKTYVLYFPQGGEVMLDLSALGEQAEIQWVELLKNQWDKIKTTHTDSKTSISAPSEENWIGIITSKQ
jgi:hypothetical protein